MCHSFSGPLRQGGAGLPIALFVITVLALVVVGMAQMQQATGESVSLQIQSQRAFYSAESGAQVAVARVLDGASCSALSTPLVFNTGALSGCRSDLTCESVTGNISGPGGNTVYTITSVGQCGAGPDQSVRRVEVRVR